MAGLEGTVNVPLAGRQPKKLVAGGVLVVGTAVIIYYVRSKKAGAAAPAAAAAAATATDQYPPDGTTGDPADLYSTDPATGQTYGDELAGSGGAYGADGTGAASGMYYDPATGAYDLTSPYGTSPATQPYGTQGGPPFSNNSAWTDWVIQELVAQDPAVDTGALTDALGVYLNGQVPTAAQKTLIFDAIAIAGNPPVAGTGGYPPNVKAPAQNNTTEVVPVTVGKTAGEAHNLIVAAHLVPAATGTQKPTDIVTSTSPAAGARVAENSTVTITARAKATAAARVKVPVTFGDRVDDATAKLTAAGLKYKLSASRKPSVAYYSRGTTPQGGTSVAKGSEVTVNITTTKP